MYSLIKSENFNFNDELIFDRNPHTFSHLLHYIRFGEIDTNKLNRDELENLKEESDFFEFEQLLDYLNQKLRGVDIIKMELSGEFLDSKGKKAGTNKLEDIKNNKQLKVGAVCTNSPGWIVFYLNCDWEITSIDLGPYIGDVEKGFKSIYGIGSTIYASSNNIVWTDIGKIPNTFGNKIINICLKTVPNTKYIKIQNSNNPIGISYINLNPKLKK